MIINGKDVSVNFHAAQKTQERIDKASDIPETAKTEVSKKEQRDLLQSFSGEYSGYSSYGDMFGSQNNTLNATDGVAENRAAYYQIFDDMDSTPFVHRGLQVIADDACQKNTEGDTVKVYSGDDEIKGILEDLFHSRLNLNKELWSIFFETIKYGDNFYEIIPDNYEHPTQIARIRYLDPVKVNRIESNGKLAFYTYRADSENDYQTSDADLFGFATNRGKAQAEMMYKLEPWQIVHFKITDKKFTPYGGSLLTSGVQTYRRYTMLEDAMMIYRLARVPERRIFKIDVGNLSTSEAMRAVNRIKDNYRTNQIMDDKGNINRAAAALSLTQDIFVPVREGQSGTEITSLAPGQALNNIDDIRYFRDELLWTLNIPPEYLGFTSDQGGGGQQKGSLAMQDVKFARFIERIQYYIEEGLTKIAAIELFFKKKKNEDLKNFRLELTPPSNVKEIMDVEFLNSKMGLISAMAGTQLFPKDFILKYVMKLSRKEIADINLQKDAENMQAAGAGGAMGGGMDMGMGGAAPMGAPAGGMDMGAGGAAQPMMSVKTENFEPKVLSDVFGKDVLIEHKEDYAKIMAAYDEYKKAQETQAEKKLVDEGISDNEFVSKVRELLIDKETKQTNDIASNLYYENELGGLNYSREEFSVYKKQKNPKLLNEEITREL